MDIEVNAGIVAMSCGFMAAFFFLLLLFFPSSCPVKAARNASLPVKLRGLFQWSVLGLFGVGLYLQIFWMEMLLGILFDALFFYSLFETFISTERKKFFIVFSRIGDFVLAIIVTAYLLYKVPDSNFQTILISLVSSFLGGGCTLAGVLLTLRRSDEQKNKERIEDNRPFLIPMFRSSFEQEALKNTFYGYFRVNTNGKFSYRFNTFFVKNSDHAYATLVGLYVNKELLLLKTEKLFWKNEACSITIENDVFTNNELKELSLLVEDQTKHYYRFPLSFRIKNDVDGKRYIDIENVFYSEMLNIKSDDFRYLTGLQKDD